MKIFKILLLIGLLTNYTAGAQVLDSSILGDLKFRNIGPAFTSGRIADIAINPQNENIMYVAAGSGGVWKT